MRCPCYKCEDRQAACHAECERYLDWWGDIQARKRFMRFAYVADDYKRAVIYKKMHAKERKTKIKGGRHEQ